MPSDLEKSCYEHKNPILFDIGIPNLVCGRILGVTECRISLSVSVTLLSGLSFRKISYKWAVQCCQINVSHARSIIITYLVHYRQ